MAAPMLLLRPEGSRNRAGAVTPTPTGAISTVPGRYGLAWRIDADGKYLAVPLADHLAPRGTLLVRARYLGDVIAPHVVQSLVGAGSAVSNRLTLGRSGAVGDRVFLGSLNLSNNNLSDNTPHTWAMTWDGATATLSRDGTLIASGAYTWTLPTGNLLVGAYMTTAYPANADIEAVLLYDRPLPDAEIARLSTMPGAWTWANTQRPAAPLIRLGHPPAFRVGS